MNQEELDTKYPGGVQVTLLNDDQPTFSTPRLLLVEDSAAGTTITCQALEFEKDLTFVAVGWERTSPSVEMVLTPEGSPDVLLSTAFDARTKRLLQNARKEWYG